jgi:hypothetical protein
VVDCQGGFFAFADCVDDFLASIGAIASGKNLGQVRP